MTYREKNFVLNCPVTQTIQQKVGFAAQDIGRCSLPPHCA